MKQSKANKQSRNLAFFGFFYFLIFCTVGVFLPWIPPFLRARGFSDSTLPMGLALVYVSRALFPPLWGVFADRLGKIRPVLMLTAWMTCSAVFFLSVTHSYWLLLVLLFLYGFFFVPITPLIETLTLDSLGDNKSRYGQVRLWGSVGFILASWATGVLVARFSVETVPLIAGLPLLVAGSLSYFLPAKQPGAKVDLRIAQPSSIPKKELTILLLVVMLGQASHCPYYAFFTIQWTDAGVASSVVGALWALGVVAEVLLMALSPRLLVRLGLLKAMRYALVFAGLRWLLFSWTDSLLLVGVGQIFHAASFGLLHMAAVQRIDRIMPAHRKALGQSLMSSVVFGLGVGLGMVLAGQMVNDLGYSGLYGIASLFCLVSLAVSLLLSTSKDSSEKKFD